jgi:hypothetical protein
VYEAYPIAYYSLSVNDLNTKLQITQTCNFNLAFFQFLFQINKSPLQQIYFRAIGFFFEWNSREKFQQFPEFLEQADKKSSSSLNEVDTF